MMALSPADQAMVDAFLASNRPRRYPNADSGDDWNLLRYLERKGLRAYPRLGATRALMTYIVGKKVYTRVKFIAFVNKLRAEDGLPAIGSAA